MSSCISGESLLKSAEVTVPVSEAYRLGVDHAAVSTLRTIVPYLGHTRRKASTCLPK